MLCCKLRSTFLDSSVHSGCACVVSRDRRAELPSHPLIATHTLGVLLAGLRCGQPGVVADQLQCP
eukprot:1653938-Alexandrium_andersonii.AAC.1